MFLVDAMSLVEPLNISLGKLQEYPALRPSTPFHEHGAIAVNPCSVEKIVVSHETSF